MKKTRWLEIILLALIISIMGFIAIPAVMNEVMNEMSMSLNKAIENVVQIKCMALIPYYDNYGILQDGWQGTGIFIKDDLILTAGHIVDGVSDINVFTVDGKKYKVKSWYLEIEADIGFIKVETPEIEISLRFGNAKFGETVWAYGNSLGEGLFLTRGIVSKINTPDTFMNTKNMVVVDAAINPGNSGCPIFDKQGNILGMCSWSYNYAQGMSYFVRADVIKLSLEKYKAIKALEEIE